MLVELHFFGFPVTLKVGIEFCIMTDYDRLFLRILLFECI